MTKKGKIDEKVLLGPNRSIYCVELELYQKIHIFM